MPRWFRDFFRRRRAAYDLGCLPHYGNTHCGIKLEPYLKQFSKKGALPEPAAGGGLELKFVRKGGDGGQLCLMDAKYHIVLFYRVPGHSEQGLANIGFNLSRYRPTVLIKQLQARRYNSLDVSLSYIKGNPEEHKKCAVGILKSLRWEKMLIQMVSDWAAENGFKKIAILKSKYNPWYERDFSFQNRNERLKMHYDVTPVRMGFSDGGSRYWVKKVRPR